jgi:hypothetical protein
MKRVNETANYLANKHKIFVKLINAIATANIENVDKIYIKDIKILEETVDVIAEREEWPSVLAKAEAFFDSIEEYEMCQRCKILTAALGKPDITS